MGSAPAPAPVDHVSATPGPPGVSEFAQYRMEGGPRIHRGLPSSTLTLILALEEPLETSWKRGGGKGSTHRNWTLLSDLHTDPAYVAMPPTQVGVQLGIHPLAARRILGCPAAALPQGSCEASDVAGGWLAQLRERVEASSISRGRQLVHASIRQAWEAGSARERVRAEVVRAWLLLTRSGGRMRIGQIADDVGLTERRLSTLFAEEVGRSPKTVAQLIRFERAVELIRQTNSLVETSTRCGFSDQSHLDRTFGRFAGCSPTRWAAEAGVALSRISDLS